MATSLNKILSPPTSVRGMMELEKDKFRKLIEFPSIKIPTKLVNRIVGLSSFNKYRLECLPRLKTYRNTESENFKRLLFDPDKLFEIGEEEKEEIIGQIEKQINSKVEFEKFCYLMEYEDWTTKNCLKAILPENVEFSGFEQCGHIIHLNLREKLLPFRFVIGRILLDKIQRTRTVINKLDSLTHDYRIMDVELLAGDADYATEVTENGIRYKLDYSKVFWNSRLITVHSKTVEQFDQNSVVFDVFCGIGPFILPAVKIKNVIKAYGNDLNPDAIDFLKQNAKLNKISEDKIEGFVLNGAEFIQKIIPEKIYFHCKELEKEEKLTNLVFHVVMNLPGYSAEHLPYFCGFLSKFEEIRNLFKNNSFSIFVHCHFFVKGNDDVPISWYDKEARRIVCEKMGMEDVEIKVLFLNLKDKKIF
uniref:tRNA (guanine(37)-N1)-methyltransferase n=1 Tax=Meloidogyne incognita TaxID=6306 RepID=A0A914KMR2_MELIC